jgi:hypothetical protein
MRSVLFLDDNEYRHAEFRRTNHETAQIYQARTVADFLSQLFAYPGVFDEVHLDHDLGIRNIDGDGMMAAQVLALLPADRRPGLVHIHTWNMQCGDRMEAFLRAAGFNVTREPFPDTSP